MSRGTPTRSFLRGSPWARRPRPGHTAGRPRPAPVTSRALSSDGDTSDLPPPWERSRCVQPRWTTLTCAGDAAVENGPRVSASLPASGTHRPVASSGADPRQPGCSGSPSLIHRAPRPTGQGRGWEAPAAQTRASPGPSAGLGGRGASAQPSGAARAGASPRALGAPPSGFAPERRPVCLQVQLPLGPLGARTVFAPRCVCHRAPWRGGAGWKGGAGRDTRATKPVKVRPRAHRCCWWQ